MGDSLAMAVTLISGEDLARRAGEIQARAERGEVFAVRDGRMPSRGIRCSIVPGLPREVADAVFVDLDGRPVTWPSHNGHRHHGPGHQHAEAAHA